MRGILLLLLLAFATVSGLALVPSTALAAPVGEVAVLKGSASRHPPDGGAEELSRGDKLFAGDRIETASRSVVMLRFADNTRFNLGPNASFRVDAVSEDEDGIFSAEVLRGAFRFVTGLIAKKRPRAMRVKTGVVATIGIRGTTVGGEVEGESATIVLLESEDEGSPSAIEVANEHGSVTINKPGFGTRVPDRASPPSPPERMTLRAIDNLVRNLNTIQRISVPRPTIR